MYEELEPPKLGSQPARVIGVKSSKSGESIPKLANADGHCSSSGEDLPPYQEIYLIDMHRSPVLPRSGSMSQRRTERQRDGGSDTPPSSSSGQREQAQKIVGTSDVGGSSPQFGMKARDQTGSRYQKSASEQIRRNLVRQRTEANAKPQSKQTGSSASSSEPSGKKTNIIIIIALWFCKYLWPKRSYHTIRL